MKPWREIAIPHRDVLEGTFQQSEFAADITAVHSGKASKEYQDAAAFFDRTFITEGMRLLLTQIAQRLVGNGGEPVVQLQTAFGGGKTHTMLAVYHLATRKCALSELAGIPSLIEQAGMMDVPQARVAVLDGTAHAPAQPWTHGNQAIKTLWGELAWQLGGSEGLTVYLPAGWDAVVEKDIDGDRAETTELENKEPRFGQVNAARRVARTLFLGSAPSSVAGKAGIRGLDRARVLLGCLQPGQTSATYIDVLNRLADRLHYLNSSGDKTQEATRFWFDTRANLRREMEDRKRRFDDNTDVRGKIGEALKKMVGSATFFDGVHIFTPHGDVPDDSALRLVVLSPENCHSRDLKQPAERAVLDYVRNNGTKPRYRGNRLVFLAPDMAVLARLRDTARVALAWNSIVDDVKEGRLNIDLLQKKQAENELLSAEEVVPRAARECYKWLLCPVQNSATDPKPTVEAFPLNSSGGSAGNEIERVCIDNELVITTWSPIHLRTKLKELYWKDGKNSAGAMTFWEDTLKYLYLPRLKNRDSLVHPSPLFG